MKQNKIFLSVKNDFNEKENTIKHIISTNEVDRYNESLDPMGMVDENFTKNGQPVLWMHNSFAGTGPSKMICGTSLYRARESDKVIAKTRFLNTELGNDVKNFYKEGYLNSWSVGWKPLSKPEYKNGVSYYAKWELVEYSAVIIPANPGCVNLMFRELKSNEMYNVLSAEMVINELREELESGKEEIMKIKDEIRNFSENNSETEKIKNEIISKVQKEFAGIAGEIKELKEQRVSDLLAVVPQLVTGAISRFVGKS